MTFASLMFEVVLSDIKEIGYACETHDCDQIAVVVTHWPGQDGKRCEGHRAGLDRIAEALGFTLHTTPLPVKLFEPEPDDASVRARMLELR